MKYLMRALFYTPLASLALMTASCGIESPPSESLKEAVNSTTEERMSESNDSRNFLEEQVTAAADALGTRRIERLAEVGCTTNADPEAQAKVTQWEAYTSLDVESDEQADEMARDLASALLGNNWHGELTSQGVTGEPFRTLLQATSHEGGGIACASRTRMNMARTTSPSP